VRLSDRDRKLLWGGAGRRCARCRRKLVVEAVNGDRESIVGDEAHIIAEAIDGPRGRDGDRTNLESYGNAILLCKVDHKIVDDQPSAFPVAALLQMKAGHERWVDEALDAAEKEVALSVANVAVARETARTQAMSRFSPSDWCVSLDGTQELIVRAVATLPSPVQLGPVVDPRPTGQLGPETRETFIEQVLDAAPITGLVRSQAAGWGWAAEHGWRSEGGTGNRELTRLSFDIEWPSYHIRRPIGMTASVLTGPTGIGSGSPPGLVLAIDLIINLTELDASRRPANMAYRSTPPPVPAALSLAELAAYLRPLVGVGAIAHQLTGSLLSEKPSAGVIALWLQLGTVELERVVRLDSLKRLRDGLMVRRWTQTDGWALDVGKETPDAGGFVRDFLAGLLEHADYRRFQEEIDAIVQKGK